MKWFGIDFKINGFDIWHKGNLNPDNKVDKITGKGLSTEDFTTTEKNKLSGVAVGANKYTLPTATTSVLGGVKSGTDVTVDASGNVSVNDDSHNHIIDNVDGLQTQLNEKAPLASPALTGTPKAPTATAGTNTTQIATTAFVQGALSSGGYGDMLKSVYDSDSDGKVNSAVNSDKVNGLTVLTAVPSGAKFTDTVYTHPANHPASMITESTAKRFISDTEKSTWNAKETTTGSQSKANTAETNAKAYTDTHDGNTTKHITSTERTNWNDANSKKHTHSNKTVIDTITQALINTWNTVTNKADKTYVDAEIEKKANVLEVAFKKNISNTSADYTDFVIPLCTLDNTLVSADYFAHGTVFLKRGNILSGQITSVDIICGKNYNSENPVFSILKSVNSNLIKPVTFNYNSTKYFGLHIKITGANYTGQHYFIGNASDISIIDGISVYNNNTSMIVNSEIYNSLVFITDSVLQKETEFYKSPVLRPMGDSTIYKIWNETNDGSGSGLDADKLDNQEGSYYLNYNNHTNKPTIPTQTSQLTNNSGFITASSSITGNASTSSKLETARKINGVSFDGTSDITIADSTKEPSFSKNTAFNKNFGTVAGTVTEGNDSRLSNARTPTTHSHTASDLPSGTTSAKGVVQLSSVINSTSTSLAATSSAVKSAYDKGNHSHPYAPSSHEHDRVNGIKVSTGTTTPSSPSLNDLWIDTN